MTHEIRFDHDLLHATGSADVNLFDFVSGRISYVSGGDEMYIRGFLDALSKEALAAIAHDFNIVVDYANADSSGVLPAILRRLQCRAMCPGNIHRHPVGGRGRSAPGHPLR